MHLTIFTTIIVAILTLAALFFAILLVMFIAEEIGKFLGGLVALVLIALGNYLNMSVVESTAFIYQRTDSGEWKSSRWLGSFKDADGIRHKISNGVYIYGGPKSGPGYEFCEFPVVYTSHHELEGMPVENLPEKKFFTVAAGDLCWVFKYNLMFKASKETYSLTSETDIGFYTVWEVHEVTEPYEEVKVYRLLKVDPPYDYLPYDIY